MAKEAPTFHCKLCGEPHPATSFNPTTFVWDVPSSLVGDKEGDKFFIRCVTCPSLESWVVLETPRRENELAAASKWVEAHVKQCRPEDTNWARWGVQQTPTGIGTQTVVVCKHCKTRLNVTDYESW